MMVPILVFAMSMAAGENPPVRSVPSLDLSRYAGRWYEIARYPNRFQAGCAGDVSATYQQQGNGTIRVVNRCRRSDGSENQAVGAARVVKGSGNGRLKVRFAPAWLSVFPFVWGDYWVIGLAEDYRWAVVGTPDRKYLWILARTPALPPSDWDAAVAKAVENGFDATRLQRTAHGQAAEKPKAQD